MLYKVFIVCLLLSPVSATLHEEECDRERSRVARSIISKYILQRVSTVNYTLPANCPFNPQLDLFLWQEEHKKKLRQRGLWKCEFCQKRFESEWYLDRHLALRHRSEYLPNATHCLADLCPLLHCDSLMSSRRHRCHHGVSDQLQKRCEMMMHVCFPATSSREAGRLYSIMRNSICGAHICDEIERERALRLLHVINRFSLHDFYAIIIIVWVAVAVVISRKCQRQAPEHDD